MGFNISEIVQGSGWKNFMKYLYGWGASIVILGALFKILHLPGASTMLMFGMGIEAIIFFFSAFEPIHEEVDWTLVYPELAGMSDEEELRKYRSDSKHGGPLDADSIKEIISSVVASSGGGQAGSQTSGSSQVQQATVGVGGALVFTEKFNRMLENAEIGPELFDKVGKGLNKLGETSTKLADISNAAVATNEYTEKMKKASESIGSFTENHAKSGQVLNESINILSENYQKTAGIVAESGQDFMNGVSKSVTNLQDQLTKAGENVSGRITESGNKVATELSTAANGLTSTYKQATDSLNLTYQQLSDAMKANGNLISEGSGGYKEQLERLNKNMSALNAAHELHLQETNQRLKEAEKVYSGVDGMMKKINTSVTETEKFAQALELLNKNISALNSVYGNMLSAMNVMSNGK
ncbi:MAG: gliding motility protein GldL [Bacteroidales bacterium]|nr:MAG: gliding motility protein GldL [Bacteroidales bacterium]